MYKYVYVYIFIVLIDFFFLLISRIIRFLSINRIACVLLFSTIVIELYYMPFDFIGDDSELVSRFNIEYTKGRFTLISFYFFLYFFNGIYIIIII